MLIRLTGLRAIYKMIQTSASNEKNIVNSNFQYPIFSIVFSSAHHFIAFDAERAFCVYVNFQVPGPWPRGIFASFEFL